MPSITDKNYTQIVDMSAKEFKEYVDLCKPTLGETLSLKNFLNLTYDSLNAHKEDLIKKHNEPNTSEEDKSKITKTVKDILTVMLHLESKCCILKERADLLVKQTEESV